MSIQTYTVEKFQENWNTMIARVKNDEYIEITDENNTVVMIPVEDELIRIYTDHEEGS